MIKLIIFDLWKTLIYREGSYSSTEKMLQATKVDLSPKEMRNIFEETIQTKKYIQEERVYAQLCQKMGLKDTNENVNLLMSIRNNAEKRIKVYDHTISMLKNLKKNGYEIGLVSNSGFLAIQKVKNANSVLEYIDYPVYSFEVGAVKPSLVPFRKILEISGYLPHEIVMVGDNFEHDVVPARKLGMNAILYTDYSSLKEEFQVLSIKID